MADYDTSGAVSVGQLETTVTKLKDYTDGKKYAVVLEDLPTATLTNDFSTDVGFVAKNRVTAELATDDDGNSYADITAGTNAANQYAYAYYDLSSTLTTDTTSAVIEFDALINEGSRMKISLIDISARADSSGDILPGDSSKDNYDATGVAFRFGEYNTGYAMLQNSTPGCTFGDWFHFKYVIDMSERTIAYTITNNTSGTALFTGSSSFLDDAADVVSGIEIYGYVNSTSVYFDNLDVTANYDAQESVLYLIGDSDSGYTIYVYHDGEPQIVGQNITVDTELSYSSTNPLQNRAIGDIVKNINIDLNDSVHYLAVDGTDIKYVKNDDTYGSVSLADMVYTHPEYSASIELTDSEPSFGDTVTVVTGVTTNTTGHVTKLTEKTVTIPSTEATTGAAGLMSATDKTNLESAVQDLYGDSYGTVSSISGTANGISYYKTNGVSSTATLTSLNASLLTGTIDIARLPATALERCVVVADDTARFALTTDSVQLGDTVKVTGTNLMYMVVDTDNLSSEAGYVVYNASVTWDNVSGKVTASTSTAGLMTAAMVTKLNGIATGATAVTVDTALDASSTNPVQNKAIASELTDVWTEFNTVETDLGKTLELETEDTSSVVNAVNEILKRTEALESNSLSMASDDDVNAMLTAVFG